MSVAMEATAVAEIRSGQRELDDYGYASTSEWQTVCLCLGTVGSATLGSSLRAAWERVNEEQRDLVRRENPQIAAIADFGEAFRAEAGSVSP